MDTQNCVWLNGEVLDTENCVSLCYGESQALPSLPKDAKRLQFRSCWCYGDWTVWRPTGMKADWMSSVRCWSANWVEVAKSFLMTSFAKVRLDAPSFQWSRFNDIAPNNIWERTLALQFNQRISSFVRKETDETVLQCSTVVQLILYMSTVSTLLYHCTSLCAAQFCIDAYYAFHMVSFCFVCAKGTVCKTTWNIKKWKNIRKLRRTISYKFI